MCLSYSCHTPTASDPERLQKDVMVREGKAVGGRCNLKSWGKS
jgi:hypothetical protein